MNPMAWNLGRFAGLGAGAVVAGLTWWATTYPGYFPLARTWWVLLALAALLGLAVRNGNPVVQLVSGAGATVVFWSALAYAAGHLGLNLDVGVVAQTVVCTALVAGVLSLFLKDNHMQVVAGLTVLAMFVLNLADVWHWANNGWTLVVGLLTVGVVFGLVSAARGGNLSTAVGSVVNAMDPRRAARAAVGEVRDVTGTNR